MTAFRVAAALVPLGCLFACGGEQAAAPGLGGNAGAPVGGSIAAGAGGAAGAVSAGAGVPGAGGQVGGATGASGGSGQAAGAPSGGAGGSGGGAGSPGLPEVARILSYSLIGKLRQDGWPVCKSDGSECDYAVKKTAPGYVHETIPLGNELLKRLAVKHQFELKVYEGAARDEVVQEFTFEKLSAYRAVVFNNPNGLGLSPAQRDAFKRYINQGGGYVGIHAGINCENDWPWFHDFVGAFEVGVIAPNLQTLTVLPGISTEHLPATWSLLEEWHQHTRSVDLQPNIKVLLRRPGGPVAWHQEYDGGRMWYTGLGHVASTFAQPDFEEHVWRGLRWAARLP